jgi:hypothetical protein
MPRSQKLSVIRRNFLRGAAVAGAATLVLPGETPGVHPAPSRPSGRLPLISPVPEIDPRADVDVLTEGSSGSGHMVDVIKSLDFEYNCGIPGSSFRALHSANSKRERTSSVGTNHGEIQEAVC